MKIGLLTVGTEILLGDTVNTNLSKLGSILYNSGFYLNKEITVSDERSEIEEGFKYLYESCEVIIICGGLGPTEDDITKESISEILDIKLVLDKNHVALMENRWKSRGLKMPETNIKQAMIPENAKKLINHNGTAPGLHMRDKDKNVIILPGPPNEFIPLVNEELIPFLQNEYDIKNKQYQFVLFYNQAESQLAQEINKFKPDGIDIAYLASKGVIKLRYDLKSISNKENLKFLQNLKDNFSEDILAFENIPLYTIIGNLLKEKNLTLSIVESVTGGKITSKITQVPGISNHLIYSDIVYTNFAKSKFLETEVNNSWEELVAELSIVSISKYNTDIAISILGEAGPLSSTDYPIGKIFISISSNKNTQITEHKLNGNRGEIIERAANKAIWQLIKYIKTLY